MQWLISHLELVVPLLVAALGVWWLMPQRKEKPRLVGLALTLCGFMILIGTIGGSSGPVADDALFGIFSLGAILCSVLMITCRKPVYGALWFALATLSTCGLFVLQSAPFLAAATIIVYAGAIIVTFLFVIMLAQQSGATVYDQRASQPLAASLGAFVLLGALLSTLQGWADPTVPNQPPVTVGEVSSPTDFNPLSRLDVKTELDVKTGLEVKTGMGTMKGLGRSLFGDYLFAVELAGTLLLIASIGAIVIAPKRSQGTL